MAKKTRMINVFMSEDLIKRIDDFRFKNRFDTRAEAMRFLMEWGLKNYKCPGAKDGMSSDKNERREKEGETSG